MRDFRAQSSVRCVLAIGVTRALSLLVFCTSALAWNKETRRLYSGFSGHNRFLRRLGGGSEGSSVTRAVSLVSVGGTRCCDIGTFVVCGTGHEPNVIVCVFELSFGDDLRRVGVNLKKRKTIEDDLSRKGRPGFWRVRAQRR